ncbi:MAG: hypothetical protein AAFX93_11420 [Verrucomicrobiota bacterium]
MFFRKKSKSQHPEILGFDQRVEQFWLWYAENAGRFYDVIEDGRCEDLTDEVANQVQELLPGMAWVFGPGSEEKGGHSFTLSPEGNAHKRLLTEYWVQQAPDLEHWTFYSSRQPSVSFSGSWAIQIHEKEIVASEIWVSLSPRQSDQHVDLVAWHPAFAELPEGAAYQILFIMLDEVLGEDGVEKQLGSIDIGNDKLAEAIPLNELRSELEELSKNWEKPADGRLWSSYQLPEPDDSFPRSDTIAGSSCHMRLINEFLNSEGQTSEDPIGKLGATFAFISFPSSHLPNGEQVIIRGQMEDKIIESFEASGQALHLGGAIGRSRTYIDLLLFDRGRESLSQIREIMKPYQLPKDSAVYPFFGNTGKAIFDLA